MLALYNRGSVNVVENNVCWAGSWDRIGDADSRGNAKSINLRNHTGKGVRVGSGCTGAQYAQIVVVDEQTSAGATNVICAWAGR